MGGELDAGGKTGQSERGTATTDGLKIGLHRRNNASSSSLQSIHSILISLDIHTCFESLYESSLPSDCQPSRCRPREELFARPIFPRI